MTARLDELVPLCGQLGIPTPVATLYGILLRSGPCSEAELQRLGVLPSRELRPALGRLERTPLIGRTRKKSKRLYYATEPSMAWLALITDLAWAGSDTLGTPDPDRLQNPKLLEFRSAVADIIQIASALYQPQDPISQHQYTRSDSALALAKLTCEAILLSKTRVRAVSRRPRLPHVALFWAALTQRIDAGVSYQRLADLDEVVNHGLLVVERDMRDYRIGLRILEDEQIKERFYLIDTRYLVLHDGQTASSTGRPALLSGSVTSERFKVRRFSQRFDALYDEALPGRVVVSALKEHATTLITRAGSELGPEGASWIESLVGMGKFSTWLRDHEPNDPSVGDLVARGEAAGLIRLGDDDRPLPNYSLPASFLTDLRERLPS